MTAPAPAPAPAAPTLVAAEGVTVAHGGQTVLSAVDLAVHAGEILTIVGPNGSGKSTLIKVLVGAIRPDAGRVVRARGLRIGYVPQRLAIDHTLPLTLDRFLQLATRRGAPSAARAEAMARVGVTGLGGRQMAALSGGQFQRALLAGALLADPELLVLDEAAQGLDQPGVARFYRLIEELRRDLGCGVLMVSHDLHVVMSASDRDLPQRACLLRGRAERRLRGAGLSGAVRPRDRGGARPLSPRTRPPAWRWHGASPPYP